MTAATTPPTSCATTPAPWGPDPAIWRFARVADPAEQAALLRQLGVVVIPDGFGDYEHNAALLVCSMPRAAWCAVFDLAEQDLALNYARHLARQAQHPSAEGGMSQAPKLTFFDSCLRFKDKRFHAFFAKK